MLLQDPKLFNGLKFYFVGKFSPSFADDLEKLILAAGGEVVESKESLMQPRTSKSFIVYNPESQEEGCPLAEELSASSGSKIIHLTWVLESIAACKLQSSIN